MTRIQLCSTHVFPLRYYSVRRTWQCNPRLTRNFLSFGDAIDCLRYEASLEGRVILLPSFYCEDTVALFQSFAHVVFYNMNWRDLEVDKDSFVDALTRYKPKAVLLYNVFGKDCAMLKDIFWLSSLSEDSIIISDCAHSLLPLHELTPLTPRHFFIDSARKCTPFMFAQMVFPVEPTFRACPVSRISLYSLKCRLLFSLIQLLAALHYISGFRFLAEWSENIFMVHNCIIGLNGTPHAAWAIDPIGYSHIRFAKVANLRLELWSTYLDEFSNNTSIPLKTFPFTCDQIRQMCYFPIRIQKDLVPDLIAYCSLHDVYVDRLWNIEEIIGLPEAEYKAGMEIVVLPLTTSMNLIDADRIASTVQSFFIEIASATSNQDAVEENSCNSHIKSKVFKTRLVELAVGLGTNQTINYLFDYALYPFVIYRFGIFLGGLVMMVLSFIACLLSVWFYDWSKCDWLGIEAIKSLKGYSGDKKLGRLTGWLLSKSDPVVFLFLSIKYDPFITMTYMRHGSHQYNGMSTRDWRIFLSSVAISNIYWTLAAYMGISVVEWVWRVVKGGVW